MRLGFSQTWVVAIAVWWLAGGGIRAQEKRQEQVRFVQAKQLPAKGISHSAVASLGDHPLEVRGSEYNLGYATQVLVNAMPKFAAVGRDDGRSKDVYIPGTDHPNLRWKRDRFQKSDVKGSNGRMLAEAGVSAAFSDYDRSGHESLFVAGRNCLSVYRNDGRAFIDVTKKIGLEMTPGLLCAGVTLGDLDGDGFPDLVVAAYTDLAHPPTKSVFTFPNDFSGVPSRLYRNNGDGTFSEVTEAAGLGNNPGRTRKAILADFDNDHRLDILLLRDEKPPVLYLNRGGWKFEDKTWDAGEELTTHAFFEGVAADFNHDGDVDLALWSTHSFRLLLNQGNALFERTAVSLMPDPYTSLFGFRGFVADVDGNGFDDIVTVDQKRQLRSFANFAGKFEEIELLVPPGLEQSLIQPLRLQGTLLLSRQQDGSVTMLELASRESQVRHVN